ncbi:hypothetical protein H632_c269p0, partial [Helicosporidium sp. ATCC 50920]
GDEPKFGYAVYYDSWADGWVSDPKESNLSKIPKYVTHLLISFMQPDAQYTPGSFSFQGTGIQFSYDGTVVRDAIRLLKQKNPHTKVLIAVGGATYYNWAGLNTKAVADFVKDFGLDGADLDYEPTNPGCRPVSGKYTCVTDIEYTHLIKELRKALPRPLILANAAFHVGAYGEGDWANAQPQSQHTGISLAPLRDAGDDLDVIMLMSYDAGPTYDPTQGVAAYSHIFKKKVMLGVQVAPEAWGGHEISIAELDRFTTYVKEHNSGGLMLWSAFKNGKTERCQADELLL